MSKFFIGSLLGVILGGGFVFYFFVGVPRSVQPPGALIQPPDTNTSAPTTAQIVLKQEFFNDVFQTIFRDMKPPMFPLGNGSSEQCANNLTLLPESGGVRSSLSFQNQRIVAPLAFRGNYNSMLGCLSFSGWSQASMDLRFDAEKQIVFGQLNIETVNLDGVNPLLSGIITPLVQSTLNQRVNPIQILQVNNLALSLPITASEANLNARVKDVRSEIKDNALHFYLIYEFNGAPMKN